MGKPKKQGSWVWQQQGRHVAPQYQPGAAPSDMWKIPQCVHQLARMIPTIPAPTTIGTAHDYKPFIAGRAMATIFDQSYGNATPPTVSVVQRPRANSGRVVQRVQPTVGQGKVKMPGAQEAIRVTVLAKGPSAGNSSLSPESATSISVGNKRKAVTQRPTEDPFTKKAKSKAKAAGAVHTAAALADAGAAHITSPILSSKGKLRATPVAPNGTTAAGSVAGAAAAAEPLKTVTAGQKARYGLPDSGKGKSREQTGALSAANAQGAGGDEMPKDWQETAAALLERTRSTKETQATTSAPQESPGEPKAAKAKRDAIIWCPTAAKETLPVAPSLPLTTSTPPAAPNSVQPQRLRAPKQRAPEPSVAAKKGAAAAPDRPAAAATAKSAPPLATKPPAKSRQAIPVPGQQTAAAQLKRSALSDIQAAAPPVKKLGSRGAEAAIAKSASPQAVRLSEAKADTRSVAEASDAQKTNRQPISWRPCQVSTPAFSPLPSRVIATPALTETKLSTALVSVARMVRGGKTVKKGQPTDCAAGQRPQNDVVSSAAVPLSAQKASSPLSRAPGSAPKLEPAQPQKSEQPEAARDSPLAAPSSSPQSAVPLPAGLSVSAPDAQQSPAADKLPAEAPSAAPSSAVRTPPSDPPPAEMAGEHEAPVRPDPARPAEYQRAAHGTSSASENSAGRPRDHQPQDLPLPTKHCSIANSAEDDGEANGEEELELDYEDDCDVNGMEGASEPPPAVASGQATAGDEQEEKPESTASSLAVSGLESAGDDYWLDEDGEQQSSHKAKPPHAYDDSPHSPQSGRSRSPPRIQDNTSRRAPVSPSHSGVQGRPRSARSPDRPESNYRTGRGPQAEHREWDGRREGRLGRRTRETQAVDHGRGRGLVAASRPPEDRAREWGDSMPADGRHPSRSPWRLDEMLPRPNDHEWQAAAAPTHHRSLSPNQRQSRVLPPGYHRPGRGTDGRAEPLLERHHPTAAPAAPAPIRAAGGHSRYPTEDFDAVRPGPGGALDHGPAGAEVAGRGARPLHGHQLSPPAIPHTEGPGYSHPHQPNLWRPAQMPDGPGRKMYPRLAEPIPGPWDRQHPPHRHGQGPPAPPQPPPQMDCAPGARQGHYHASEPRKMAGSLLGWRLSHRLYPGLKGQVIHVVPDGDTNGGPWCIVRYENGLEEELDIAQTLPRLFGCEPAPLPPALAEKSGLVSLQTLTVEPEPFGVPPPAPARHPAKRGGPTGLRHLQPRPRSVGSRGGRGHPRAKRRV